METIQFNSIVEPEEQIIRPPEGVELPRGIVGVTEQAILQPKAPEIAPLEKKTRKWLLALEQANPDLPGDMAEHHDHYAHGKPLP